MDVLYFLAHIFFCNLYVQHILAIMTRSASQVSIFLASIFHGHSSGVVWVCTIPESCMQMHCRHILPISIWRKRKNEKNYCILLKDDEHSISLQERACKETIHPKNDKYVCRS